MSRRPVDLYEELPVPAIRALWRLGVGVEAAQAWLRSHRIDGCSLGPDLFLVVCAAHDYLVRTGVVRRYLADDWARDAIVAIAVAAAFRTWRCEDELLWRVLGVLWCLLGVGYAWLFWCGVVLGDWLGVGAPDRSA